MVNKKSKPKNPDIGFYLWVAVFLQFFLYVLSSSGIGYPILKYLFGVNDRFKDTQNLFEFHLLRDPFDAGILTDPFVNMGSNVFIFLLAKIFSITGLLNLNEIYFLFNLALFATLGFLLYKFSSNIYIAVALLLSNSFLFTLGRGNLASLASIFIAISFICMLKGKYWIAVVLISLSAWYQVFYIVFAAIFFIERKYRYTVYTFLISTSMLLGGWQLFGKSFQTNFKIFLHFNEKWNTGYVIGDNGLLHNNSLFGSLKGLFYLYAENSNLSLSSIQQNVFYLNRIYTLFVLITGVSLCVVYLKTFWRSGLPLKISGEILCFVSLLSATFLPVSPDYKWLPVFFGIAYMIGTKSTFLTKQNVILIVLLMLPKYLVIYTFPWWEPGMTIGSILNPFLSLIITIRLFEFIRNSTKKTKLN
jgi:hypothetical protein